MMCPSVRRPQKLNCKFFCSLDSVLKHLLNSLILEHYHYHHHQGETYFDSFGLPRTVLCQTTGKLVLLAKFWVTAIWQIEGMKMWGNFQTGVSILSEKWVFHKSWYERLEFFIRRLYVVFSKTKVVFSVKTARRWRTLEILVSKPAPTFNFFSKTKVVFFIKSVRFHEILFF